MDRFLTRGITLTAAGIGTLYFGYMLTNYENSLFQMVLSVGVLLCGVGFVTLIYGFFRQIDKHED